MTWQTDSAGGTRWLGTAEWPGPQWSDRFGTGYRNQAQRQIAGRRPWFGVGLVEQFPYGAKILDVAPAICTADEVAKEAFSIRIAQGTVDER
jgi:hypothetical protein